MSFNLRRDVAEDGANRWSARRDLVADLVRERAPDVLGTQEGLPHQLAELDARLPGLARVGGCRRGDGTDEACAIYYSRARLRPLAWGDLWLSDTPGVAGSASWGNRIPRMVTWACFADRATGRAISVANTHLDHESRTSRDRSARFLVSRFPGAVLLGDLNAEPDEVALSILRGAGWQDGGAHEPTFHGFTGAACLRLDHVLAPRALRIGAHAVVGRERAGVHASDHHAVFAEVLPAS